MDKLYISKSTNLLNNTIISLYNPVSNFNKKENKKLIIALESTNYIRKKYKDIEKCIKIFINNSFKTNEYIDIELVIYNINIDHYTIKNIDDMKYIKNIEFKIQYDVNYKKLNNKIKDIITKSNCINFDILFITTGYKSYNQDYDESLMYLSSVIEQLICNISFISFVDNNNMNIISKYINLLKNSHFKICYNINEFNEIIYKYLKNMKHCKINNLDIRLVNNKYHFFNFFNQKLDSDHKLIEIHKNKLRIKDEIEALNNTILLLLYNDVKLDNNIIKKIEQNIKYYKKLNNTLSQNKMINMNYNLLLQKMINISTKEIKQNNISQLINYCKNNKHSNKHIYKNFNELKKLNDNLDKVLNSKLLQDFIKKKNKNKQFSNSLDFYNSALSITNWYEELCDKNILGLLLRVSSNNYGYGYNLDTTEVRNITTTLLPVEYIINAANIYYKKHNLLDFGNEFESLISGNAIGNGNSIFPLYICKENWLIARLYLEPMLGLMICQNPLAFNKKYVSFPFTILTSMINMTFHMNQNQINDKWINLLFSVFRTCYEISKEVGYNKGIHKLVNNYIQNPLDRTKDKIPSIYSILGQILVSDIKFDEKLFCKYIFEEELRRQIKSFESTGILNYLNYEQDFNIDEKKIKEFKQQIELCICDISKYILSFCKFRKLLKILISKYKSFNKFINYLDSNYSILENKDLQFTKQFVTNNLNFTNTTYDDISIFQNELICDKFIDKCIIQGIIHKNNKVRRKDIKNNNYADVVKLTYPDFIQKVLYKFKQKEYKNKAINTINYIKNSIKILEVN